VIFTWSIGVTKSPRKEKTRRPDKSQSEPKKDKPKAESGKGLFDHVSHIQRVQDPNYYANLSDGDRKSWSNFMILRALSMDRDFVDYSAEFFQYFDVIPPESMYTLLIGFVDKSKRWSPWVKSKKSSLPTKVVNFVASHFQIPTTQAEDYTKMYLMVEGGKSSIQKLMSEYGYDEKEIKDMFKL